MMNAHIAKESAVPWWAAFGAPLLGVPLLVALLALGSTADVKSGELDGKAGVAVEEVEVWGVKTTMELPSEPREYDFKSRC